jgi:thiamine-phosphate pyrophosphorylase
MPERCLLYYVTDRTAFPGDEPTRVLRVLEKIGEAARSGVDYIQLREKDLSSRELEALARQAVDVVDTNSQRRTRDGNRGTLLLINSRPDVALAAGADGVHLRSDDISPTDVRALWQRGETFPRDPILAVSCHTPEEVVQAARGGANFAVFAPVFGKRDSTHNHPAGIAALREACSFKIPVLALGGVSLENAQSCLDAGAAGIAAIRLFQENDIAAIVQKLCS